MNFLCPSCRTPLPKSAGDGVVPCTRCGVQVDLTRLDTAPGTARLWPDLDLAGESLSEYRLTRRLAAGGMGVVYEAEGPKGPCAVKVLSALLAAEPELRTRFRREASALRAIEHPGVVRILAEGEERGFCWYAMERVHGPDLRTRIDQGALPASEVEALARRLLETLAAVHAKGFVHRDIKPGNILLAATGPKLCDFGIARFDGASTLTESAAVLGSLRYMSPEQRLGRADARSDLYAVGVVLHEALAKGVPGEAVLPFGVPGKLRRLVERLLSDRPIDRPATAAAALVELDRRPRGPIALGLGAVAAISVAVWFALGVIPPIGAASKATATKDGEPRPLKAKEPKAPQGKANEPGLLAGQGNADKALQMARPPVQQQADLPQEVLQNVGLANEKPVVGPKPTPNADEPPPPPVKGLGTKGTPQLLKTGTATKEAALPNKVIEARQTPAERKATKEAATQRDPALDKKKYDFLMRAPEEDRPALAAKLGVKWPLDEAAEPAQKKEQPAPAKPAPTEPKVEPQQAPLGKASPLLPSEEPKKAVAPAADEGGAEQTLPTKAPMTKTKKPRSPKQAPPPEPAPEPANGK